MPVLPGLVSVISLLREKHPFSPCVHGPALTLQHPPENPRAGLLPAWAACHPRHVSGRAAVSLWPGSSFSRDCLPKEPVTVEANRGCVVTAVTMETFRET